MDKAALIAKAMTKIEHSGDCWKFTGYIAKDGYPYMWSGGGQYVRPHRLLYEAKFGKTRKFLMRSCQEPSCINPEHMLVYGSDAHFWSKFTERPDGKCWEWPGGRNSWGYGVVATGRKDILAHRKAWTITNGPIPNNMYICHTCDNPPCCNPSHLWLGTAQENTADMIAKGRDRRLSGPENPRTKLSPEIAQRVRHLKGTTSLSQLSIAKEVGISQQSVSAILLGIDWTSRITK